MKIGIIGAISEEIKIIQKIISQRIIQNIEDYKINIGKFKKHDIFIIKSGIGKVSSSTATTTLIHLHKPHIIINVGSAGSLNKFLKIGDLIIPKKICYYDVDLRSFGYTLGQIPKYPKKFIIKKKIHAFLVKIATKFNFQFTTELLITGDSFIQKELHIKKLKNNFPSAVAVEMESAAIAQVCYKFNIPLIVIKSISDLSNNSATLDFKKNIPIASFQSCKLVQLILENII